jgi:hypothetical protein
MVYESVRRKGRTCVQSGRNLAEETFGVQRVQELRLNVFDEFRQLVLGKGDDSRGRMRAVGRGRD